MPATIRLGSRILRELALAWMCHSWAIGEGRHPVAFAGGLGGIEMIDGPFPLQAPGESSRITCQKQFLACSTEQPGQDGRRFAVGDGSGDMASRQAHGQ